MDTLLLTASDVRRLATLSDAVEAVQHAFDAHGRAAVQMPAKVYLDVPGVGDFRAMPAAMEGAAGLKWVNSHPDNPAKHGLPSVMGMYVLSDPETALPVAVMDATLLTALRTGAAAAVATRHLARPGARTLGIVGAGVQSEFLIEAHQVLGDWEIVVADRSPDAAARVAKAYGGRVGTVQEASACDVVCTATPSRTPVVQAGWVVDGAHVNAMGADAEGKQELEEALLHRASVFWDDAVQASHSGEVNVPLHHGSFTEDDVVATLGEVVCGAHAGRPSPTAVTVFDSTGLAVQDLALAARIVQAAKAAGVGRSFDFRA